MRLYLSSYGLGSHPEKFLELVHGKRKTAVIMNAQDYKDPTERQARLQQELEVLSALGLRPEELDLRKYFGKSAELERTLTSYDALWVRGGNVFLLNRAFHQSGLNDVLLRIFQEDQLAYGGYSAGVCILAPTLRGIELVDDVSLLAEGYKPEIIWDGLGIVEYSIAPHYKSDHYESAMIDEYVAYLDTHGLPYEKLRDGEVIIIDGQKSTKLI